MKFKHLLFCVLLTLTLVTLIKGESTLRQIIWYEDMHYGYRADNYNFYFKLGSKLYKHDNNSLMDSESENPNDYAHDDNDFVIKVERSDDELYENNIVQMNAPNKHHLRFFLPEVDGTTKTPLANVVWNIKVNCGCHVTYNIRYFRCDEEATKYFNALGNTTNAIIRFKNYTNKESIDTTPESTHVKFVGLPSGQFASKQEVVDALYEVLPCVREYGIGSTMDCCLPYPCWLNMNSLQCICALDQNADGNEIVYGDACLCGIDSSSQECTESKQPPIIEVQ